jgi:hypothetical protein
MFGYKVFLKYWINTRILQNTLIFKSQVFGYNKLYGFKNHITIKIIVFLEF